MFAMKIPKTESKIVEFKSTFNQDVIVSLVAFANADGGDVYVGVRDDGEVHGDGAAQGVRPSQKAAALQSPSASIVPGEVYC